MASSDGMWTRRRPSHLCDRKPIGSSGSTAWQRKPTPPTPPERRSPGHGRRDLGDRRLDRGTVPGLTVLAGAGLWTDAARVMAMRALELRLRSLVTDLGLDLWPDSPAQLLRLCGSWHRIVVDFGSGQFFRIVNRRQRIFDFRFSIFDFQETLAVAGIPSPATSPVAVDTRSSDPGGLRRSSRSGSETRGWCGTGTAFPPPSCGRRPAAETGPNRVRNDPGRVGAANEVDLRHGHRLTVGDDGEHLERRL